VGDTEKTLFRFDLDNEDFLKAALESKNAIVDVGSKENIAELIEALSTATIAVGILGAAAFAIKAAIDLTLEAESIKRTAEQFDILAKSAGLVGEELKSGLLAAAKGLASEDDILKAANKSMIALGDSASRLPEIMELARKATLVYGGTLIDNFQNISQAMATGQTRMLKHYGITVDLSKAEETYAKSLGVTAGELTEAGKRTAVLNAALEAGQARYKDIKGDADSATSSIASFKATLKDIGEIATIAFDKIAGGTVRAGMKGLADWFKEAKVAIVDQFGAGAEQAAAHASNLRFKIGHLKSELEDLEAVQARVGQGDPYNAAIRAKQIENLHQKLLDYTTQLKQFESKQEQLKSEEAAKKKAESGEGEKDGAKGSESKVDNTKHAEQVAKFNAELVNLQKKFVDEKLALDTNFEDAEKDFATKRFNMEQELDAKIKELHANKHLTEKQAAALESQLRKNSALEFEKLEREKLKVYEQTAAQMMKVNQTTTAGMASGFKSATMSAQASLKDWSARGVVAANTLSGSLTAGFKAMGDGSKDAAEAMKDAFLKSIGDQAVAEGSKMLLAGLWPPNPVELGAGAALVALGSKLGSMSSPPSTSGGGAPGSSNASLASSAAGTTAQASGLSGQVDQSQANPQKTVTVHFNGDFLSTDQTRQQLMEMIRRESDATDFKYVQVGK
jgi:hypothetical protein